MIAYGVELVVVIVGLVQVAKNLGMPKELSPVLAIVLGIVGGIVYLYPDDLAGGILVGIAMGLAASGLYKDSGRVPEDIKKLAKKMKEGKADD